MDLPAYILADQKVTPCFIQFFGFHYKHIYGIRPDITVVENSKSVGVLLLFLQQLLGHV